MYAMVTRGTVDLPLLACNYRMGNRLKAAFSSVKDFALSHNGNSHLGIPQHHFNL